MTNLLETNIKTQQYLTKLNLNDTLISQIFECFFYGTKDYSIDAKGDSGSRIREVAIEGLEKLIITCAKLKLAKFCHDQELLTNIFGCVIQQAVERIDRTRNIAGRIFANLLYNQYLNIGKGTKIVYLKEIKLNL